MKAQLKTSATVNSIRLSEMQEGQFAVEIETDETNGTEESIIFRPMSSSNLFAVNLSDGTYWQLVKGKINPVARNPMVRVLKKGEEIIIVE